MTAERIFEPFYRTTKKIPSKLPAQWKKIVMYLLMLLKFINSKQKIQKLMQLNPLYLVNVSKDFSVDNMKETRL